jgi:DNA-directed RNA polymerase specialized sigma24 family protein
MNASKSNPTRWTLIVRAQGSGEDARTALGELLHQYEGFVLWLIRRNRPPPDVSVEDLKQEFLEGMLRRDDIAKLDQRRGSFRAWLAVAVRRFVYNEWDKWKAARSGRAETDLLPCEPFHRSTPEDAVCARAFATHVMLHVLSVQRAEARDQARFDALARFLPGPQMELVELAPVAGTLGTTPTAVAKAICEMRARFRELLREAIRDTLDTDDRGLGDPEALARAIDRELCELRRSLQREELAGPALVTP